MIRDSAQRTQQAERLRQARIKAGFKTAAAAIDKFRWKPSVYMAHENGQNGIRPEPAVEYARAYSVDPGWILTGIGPGPSGGGGFTSGAHQRQIAGSSVVTDRLPVMGMAACGPDGWSLWNGDIIDTIPRPANLAGAPNAYAVYVVGESMEPRYHSGELAHVHPGKPYNIGSYVLVQLKPDPGDSVPKAVLKRLVRRSGAKITLEQFRPPKKFDVALDDIVSIHRVVGSSEA